MHHYPAYDWERILEQPSIVTSAQFLSIPDIHRKRAWPTMQLMAFLGNALGGKTSGGEKMPPSQVFAPEEFAPPFARTLEDAPALEPQHCWALTDALESSGLSNASWVIQLVEVVDNLERIRAVAEGYGELLEREAP